MHKSISENKLAIFVLTSALCLGAYLRINSLYGGRFLWSDEYRTILNFNRYVLARTPFLNLVYKIPLYIWGRYQHVALYTTAFWGVLSILIVFAVGRALFNNRVGSYSAFILSLFASHVRYSRTGFPSVLQSVLLLSAFLALVFYLKSGGKKYIVFTGAFFGLSFLTYVSSYATIAAIFILLPVVLKSRHEPKILGISAIMGLSCLGVLILLEIIGRINTGSYFYGLLFEYRLKVSTYSSYAASSVGEFKLLLESFKRISVDGGPLQLWLVIIGVCGCAVDWFLRRERELFLLLGVICISVFFLSMMWLLGIHPVHPRHLLCLVPFLCICCAYLINKIELITGPYFVLIFLLVFSLISLPKSLSIINDTFKVTPITKWLSQHNISKDRVVSAVDIIENGDSVRAMKIPVKGRRGGAVDWEKLRRLHREGGIGYILLPGVLTPADRRGPVIGRNDKILRKLNPLKSWVHPYNVVSVEGIRVEGFNSGVDDFAIYSLDEIFK